MAKSRDNRDIDEIDRIIINKLREDSKIANTEIAKQAKRKPSTVHMRIKQLKQIGILKQYTVILDLKKLGYTAYIILVQLQNHNGETVENFTQVIQHIPEITECHKITGANDYIIKVVLKRTEDLNEFLQTRIHAIEGICTETYQVLETNKLSPAPPIT